MQYPRTYAQEQTAYRVNEAERKMHVWLAAFFKGVNLDVVSTSTQYWLFGKDYAHGTDKWQFDGSVQISDNGTGVSPYLNLVHTRGTNAAPTATQDGDTIGYIAGTGYASNSTFYAGGTIEFQSTDNWTSGARGTKIVFKTTDDGTGTFEESGYIHATGSWATGKPDLATNATKGFLYVPYTDGTPSGTPETITGRYPIIIGKDGTAKTSYFYNGSAWVANGGGLIDLYSGSTKTWDISITSDNIEFYAYTGVAGVKTTLTTGGRIILSGDYVQISTSKTPASASASGTTGMVCWDSNYVYVCVATDTWKRAAISTW